MLITSDAQHKSSNASLDNSMIPAINVVFLLLVFFMLVGHIEAQHELLKIPQSESQGELKEQTLEINILGDGQRLLDGQAIQGSLLQALQAAQVNTQTTLNLRIHKDLPVTQLDPVLSAARQLGVGHLHILTEHLP
jgi:biopolymer transport protein ExbD